jgi:hypothetical protein
MGAALPMVCFRKIAMKRLLFAIALTLLFSNTVFAQRMYDGSGRQIGRVDGERYYDGSGHQIGRADGLRRLQMIIYFYFFM